MKKPIWKDTPDQKDFPAAWDYLTLCLAGEYECSILFEQLHINKTVYRKAKDILRASGLGLLSKTNLYVARNIKKVQLGLALSPVLLVVDDDLAHPLVIADGYHRVCASYHVSENADISCRLARKTK